MGMMKGKKGKKGKKVKDMAVLGNNIIVFMNGQAIAGTKSDEIQVDSDTIEIASETDQAWTHYISGRKSWSLTVGWLVLANQDVRKVLLAGSVVTIKIKGRGESDSSGVTGAAILKTVKITATHGNLAQGSFAFVGNGPLI
jgi:predicted secreted protein